MSKIVRIRACVFFSLLAAVFSGMLLSVGCGGSDGGGGGGSGGGVPAKTPLLLDAGFAWINSNTGLVFLSDTNRVLYLYRYSGVWMISEDDKYRADNKSVTISNGPAVSYSVKDSVLTLKIDGQEEVFAKTPNIIYKPNSLVLWYKQAWTESGGEYDEGLMFLPDGRVFDLDYGWALDGGWRIERKGTYVISGTDDVGLNIYWGSGTEVETRTFAVAGDKLRLTMWKSDGKFEEKEYTKRLNVNVEY